MPALPTTNDVLRLCCDAGFTLSGVTAATPSTRAEAQVRWLADGKHGSMGWMEGHDAIRADVREVLDGAVSVICVADRYAGGEPDPETTDLGRVARYARGRDYHVHMKRRLHAVCDQLAADSAGHHFRACVDTVPIHERELAEAAGLGSIGKHTLLITPEAGSWVLLGCIVTTLPLDPTGVPEHLGADPCGTCTRCIDACPTDAITPWSVDARRCISALTIEHREPIDASVQPSMGDWVFGCDICQEVCPHNQPTERRDATAVDPIYTEPVASGVHGRSADGSGFNLETMLGWTATDRQQALQGSSMKRAKLDMLVRNAVIAAGNTLSEDAFDRVRPTIEELARKDEVHDMVREAAVQVLGRKGS